MSTHEIGSTEQGSHHPYKFLPKVLDITTAIVPFSAPVLKNFTSSLAKYEKALVFNVKTDQPFPSIGSAPALYVGKGGRPVVLYAVLSPKEYQFLSFFYTKYQVGDPIYLNYINDSMKKARKTNFDFHLPGGNVA